VSEPLGGRTCQPARRNEREPARRIPRRLFYSGVLDDPHHPGFLMVKVMAVERPLTRVHRDPVHHYFPHRIDEHGIPHRGRRALAHAEEVTVQVHGMRHRGHVLQPEAYPLASPHPDRLRSRIGLPIDCPDILTHPATRHDRPLDIGNELRPRRARPTA